MSKKLFLCNTVYQTLIAVWIKYDKYKDESADIIISDHMNGYKSIAANIEKTKLFDNVYTVDSRDYKNYKFAYKSRLQRYFYMLFPEVLLKSFIKLDFNYDHLFVANADNFTALLYPVLYKKCKIKLSIFEDGVSTYSKLFEKFYKSKNVSNNSIKRFIITNLFKNKSIYPNAYEFLVFNKSAMEWDTKCPVNQLPPISCSEEFKKIVNTVFGYDNIHDSYDKKYIFFEESFYADTGYMGDIELVEKIAALVGKENIMIKIHPRNPENRFEKLGYKTNKDTFIPWEVIAMNIDTSDKVFISIASASIVNPKILFENKTVSYSLVNCLKNKPSMLKSELTNCILNIYNRYDTIKILNDIKEIVK